MNSVLNGTKTSDDSVDLPETDMRSRIIDLLEKTAVSDPSLSVDELVQIVTSRLEIEEESLVNHTHIEATNILNRVQYESVPIEKRIVLIPHCLRDAERCKAPIDDEGYHCLKCGACVIAKITQATEEKGLKWYMVGGGSQVINIVKNARPNAVLGIACYTEASMAVEKINGYGIPTQAVLLSKDGCINTEVDFDKVAAKIDID